ncbi:MAG: helix-turn-helix transcriptional regulator [Ferruginibacter sp.]
MQKVKRTYTGAYIRVLRHLKGYKQTDAAKKLGISQQAYSKIECRERISDAKIALLIAAFNITIEELDRIQNFFQ